MRERHRHLCFITFMLSALPRLRRAHREVLRVAATTTRNGHLSSHTVRRARADLVVGVAVGRPRRRAGARVRGSRDPGARHRTPAMLSSEDRLTINLRCRNPARERNHVVVFLGRVARGEDDRRRRLRDFQAWRSAKGLDNVCSSSRRTNARFDRDRSRVVGDHRRQRRRSSLHQTAAEGRRWFREAILAGPTRSWRS